MGGSPDGRIQKHPRDSSGHQVWNYPGENPSEFSPARAQRVPMPSPKLSARNQGRGSSFESFVIRRQKRVSSLQSIAGSKSSVASLQVAAEYELSEGSFQSSVGSLKRVLSFQS